MMKSAHRRPARRLRAEPLFWIVTALAVFIGARFLFAVLDALPGLFGG
jgi:hypothetical protein